MKENNLPTKVNNANWVTITRNVDRSSASPVITPLGKFVLLAFQNKDIKPDPGKKVISLGKKAIDAKAEAIDGFAKETGLLTGKWLVYDKIAKIDGVWKSLVTVHLKGELGVSAKVATKLQTPGPNQGHLVCIYTGNYLDLKDVHRVRNKLKEMGFEKPLYYKPDIYTYLGIYSKTFPGLKASRYYE
jgi:hypothetical protein